MADESPVLAQLRQMTAALHSIDASLKTLVARRTGAAAPADGRPAAAAGGGPPVGSVASDRDLDGAYGNPVLRFMPRDWTGRSYKGRKLSDCPAELLDLVAETYDYFAQKAEQGNETTSGGKPKAPYNRQDAARARGWAARARAGAPTAATGAPAGRPQGPSRVADRWAEEERQEAQGGGRW